MCAEFNEVCEYMFGLVIPYRFHTLLVDYSAFDTDYMIRNLKIIELYAIRLTDILGNTNIKLL